MILLATFCALAACAVQPPPPVRVDMSFQETPTSTETAQTAADNFDYCAEIVAKAKDDNCVTVKSDESCEIDINVGCIVERKCRLIIEKLNDPCVQYESFDVGTRKCLTSRQPGCNDSRFGQLWKWLKTRFSGTDTE